MSTTTERVGRYQLLEPIGVGPGGSVSRAKVFGVAGFERQFAVKRFHAELTTTATMAQALSAAARAYGGLEHPRIARMSEFGVAQGTTFTAVELVSGLDALRLIAEAKLANTTLAAGGALALVSQAARAVGYAHGRGLTHLGLSPTNVIVTVDGDVKITDFGILSATLPPRPIESARLAQRIQYLAPEQLANEATSAATDVFALGVLAYELVTGQRTFKGETPQQIAQSVMAGPPGEPPLPRPIVRVLQRCLARSPFERFPDARALADALDAALRVAPVPGTRKDIGAQVKQTLDRLAELHSGEVSGLVALNVNTAAMLRGPVAPVAALGTRDSQDGMELATTEFTRETPRPSSPAARPTRTPADLADQTLLPASNTLPDLPKVPMTTVTGLAPPPIPVPKGVSPPPIPSPPPTPNAPSTLLGLANAQQRPISVPAAIKPVLGAVPPPRLPTPPPRPAEPGPVDRPSETPVSPLRMLEGLPPVVPDEPPAMRVRPTPPAIRLARADDGGRSTAGAHDSPDEMSVTVGPVELALMDREDFTPEPVVAEPPVARELPPTHEMSPLVVEQLNEATKLPTAELAPLGEDAWRASARVDVPEEPPPRPPPPPSASQSDLPIPSIAGVPSRQYPVERSTPPPSQSRNTPQPPAVHSPPARSRLPWIIAGALTVLVLGGGAYVAITMLGDEQAGGTVAAARDAGVANDTRAVAAASDAAGSAEQTLDAPIASAVVDAGGVATDAAVAAVAADAGKVAAASGDSLSITSTPPGARVFIDGADAGITPLKLPGTPDRHTIGILLAGHELYVAQVDGHGAFAIPLKEVTPTGGPAGIKVVKCKEKERYYVFVDGKPTGQTCPTERIETEIGPHVVEVYDVITETRRKFEIDIKDTRLSYRVKID